MRSRSQRKKERHKRKRQQKKEQAQTRQRDVQRNSRVAPVTRAPVTPAPVTPGSNARHRQRLLQQTPQAWPGEIPEDLAVFDDSALAFLGPDMASQAAAVRAALEGALGSHGQEALNRVSGIPRSSPLSQWRLFIRGLVAWLADDTEAAGEAWKRLDPERRPGRIAIAMMTALRPDLEQASQPGGTGEPGGESGTQWRDRCDRQLLYHARLLRRIRFDRAATRIARAGLRLPEESKKLLLGPRKIQWLRGFIAEYGETEPELAAALSQVALRRAFAQNYSDVFEDAARVFTGPRHDRRNLLLKFFYFMQFANDRAAERKSNAALDEYLKNDLPRNDALSEPLRKAIASQIHLNEALALIRSDGGEMLMGLILGAPDPKAIRKHLNASVQAYSANRPAWRAHVEWIESRLDAERLTKQEREPLENELAQVMWDWSRALPEDAEPRLWLVDYLLEHERLDEARPHVDWLIAARQDDPRVRATPWKWELLEAMRLCRRKAWLADVPERLDQAERLWPAWLSRQWLPYLRAAWTLRSGRSEAFDQERQQICEESGLARDSLADACMMLGAAQQMRVPAAALKPLRAVVDQAAKRPSQLPLEELLSAGCFFWDLHRAQLLYPGYRRHGAKLGKELLARLSKDPRLVMSRLQDEQIHNAVLWCSEHRFWCHYDLKLPRWYSTAAVARHPMFAAARVNAFLKLRYQWGGERCRDLGPLLREAAQSQRDAYYRHWFVSLADELDDVLARGASPFGPGANPFSALFGADDDEDELEVDGFPEGFEFDPDCDCPACRSAKRAYAASR